MTKLIEYTYIEHFIELRQRLFKILICLSITAVICYIYSDKLYQIFLSPLIMVLDTKVQHKVIYTNLSEVFTSYILLSVFVALIINLPMISYNLYGFIAPGLYTSEKQIARWLFIGANVLLLSAIFFVWFLVIPRAWQFFFSFEQYNSKLPLILEAKISEYLKLIINFVIAFIVAFQIPILLIALTLIKVINSKILIKGRRIAIVINFIIAGVITPPDILSQFILAIPMILLYEGTILIIKLVENRQNIC